MESQVTISESRFDELKCAEKELKETRYQLDCERHKLTTATGILKEKDEEVKYLKKNIKTDCDKCLAVKELDELRSVIRDNNQRIASLTSENDEIRVKLEQMTKFRDECERQFHDKCEELASTIADFNALKDEHAKFDMPKPRLQAKVAELLKENKELKKRLKGDCKECVSNDEAKYLGKRLKEAEDCIKKAFDAWAEEDGTDKSYNEIGRILREYIKVNSIAM